MHYNANTGPKQGLGRKIKRVPDVNSMGFNPYEQNGPQQNMFPHLDQETNNFPPDYVSQQSFNTQPQNFLNTPKAPTGPGYFGTPAPGIPQQFPGQAPMGTPGLAVFGQPIVQDMAMQYGQQLAGAGTNIIKQEVEKYVPVTKLKYYFAVDTKYVMSKLLLLFFPFTHSDWSVKFEQDTPVQPRYEINAPDLYIPTMAYMTYIVVASLVLGMQQRFSPEQIGLTGSSALAWCIVELAVYSCTLYILQIETSLKTLDLLAYSGYKFVSTITSIVMSFLVGRLGFYVSLVYTNIALAFFLVRSLKVQVLAESGSPDQSYYGGSATTGHKRRLYFLLFVAAVQPVLSWWLSFHLLPSDSVVAEKIVA